MSADTDAIALFMNSVGTLSYFDEYRDLGQRTEDLAELRAALGEVKTLSRGPINRESDDELASLDSAMDLLNQYASEADATARAALAQNAIDEATSGLTGITELVALRFESAPTRSLAYAFGALHYGMLVRQTVADTVQDGPYGAPGLLEQITAAGRLMYNDGNGGDVYSAMFDWILEQLEVNGIQGTSADPAVSFNVVSDFGGVGFEVLVTRLDGQSDEEFEDLIAAATNQQLGVVFEEEQENIAAPKILDIAEGATQFLAASAEAAAANNQITGTGGNDSNDGTALADYFDGQGGDDLYFGGAGPDALSGGAGNDILRGGEGRDMLVGGAGNDVMFGNTTRADGGAGDVARFDGLSTDHVILGGSEYAVVTGPDGSRDKLFDVSFLRFDDGDITLPDGNALDTGDVSFATLNKENFDTGERVALLYEAALNRNGDIDLPGLNFYIDVTERDNLSDEFLAADLMTSPEFTANFGDVNTLSNQQFLEQIYLNVLDRPSDADGLAFYLGLLNNGEISKALALADIAVSPENTNGSAEILQSLYETTTPETDAGTGLAIDWSFVS